MLKPVVFAIGALAQLTVAQSGVAQAGPLFDAAGRGDLAAVETLVSAGTNIDERGHNAETPLIAAALAGAQPVAEYLVDHGADVMARNKGGLTPLHAAAYAGSADIAQLLLDHGAALDDAENIGGDTPLFLAAEEDRVLVVELLLARGADPMLIDGNGLNVLAQAWVKKRIEVVRLLKSHGATCPSAEVLGSDDFHRRCVEAGQ